MRDRRVTITMDVPNTLEDQPDGLVEAVVKRDLEAFAPDYIGVSVRCEEDA